MQASLEYLQNLALYDTEKPYWCFLPPHEGFDPDKQRVDNLEFEDHFNITIHDIRESEPKRIDECGFQVLHHVSRFSRFDSPADVRGYKSETEGLLQKEMNAIFVKCYDHRLRKNITFERNQLDLNDPLLMEGPARGVHNGMLDHLVLQKVYSTNPRVVQISPTTRALWSSLGTSPRKRQSSFSYPATEFGSSSEYHHITP